MPDLPDEVEEVRVLRVGPGDRLIVTADDEVFDRLEDGDLPAIRARVAEWAGLDEDRVLVVSGWELAVLHQDERGTT